MKITPDAPKIKKITHLNDKDGNIHLSQVGLEICGRRTQAVNTADNQLNAKPVVKQRHPGDEFPVSQRGSTKGKQRTNARV